MTEASEFPEFVFEFDEEKEEDVPEEEKEEDVPEEEKEEDVPEFVFEEETEEKGPEYLSISNYERSFDTDATIILKIAQQEQVPTSFYCYEPDPQPYVGTYLVGGRHYSSVYQYLPIVENTEDCNTLLSFFPGLDGSDLLYLLFTKRGTQDAGSYDHWRAVVSGVKDEASNYDSFVTGDMRFSFAKYISRVQREAAILSKEESLHGEYKMLRSALHALQESSDAFFTRTAVEIEQTKITYYPSIVSEDSRFYSGPMNEIYGLDVFEAAVPSINVPFIKYVDEKLQQFTKIFTGDNYDLLPPFEDVVMITQPSPVSNSIYFTVYNGVLERKRIDRSETRAGDYLRCTYDLVNNQFNVEAATRTDAGENGIYMNYSDEQSNILLYMQAAFPNLNFDEKSLSYRGEFYITTKVPYNELVLADTIRTNDLYRHFFYVEEKKKLSIVHRSFDIGFRANDDVEVKLHNEKIQHYMTFKGPHSVFNLDPDRHAGGDLIRVRIMDAKSREDIERLYDVAHVLLLNHTASISGASLYVFPRASLTHGKSLGKAAKEREKLKRFGDLFTGRGKGEGLVPAEAGDPFARPLFDAEGLRIIRENAIPSTREKKTPVPKMYVKCQDQEGYFSPTFIPNTGTNFEKYPYVPFCRKGKTEDYPYSQGIIYGIRSGALSGTNTKVHLDFDSRATAVLPVSITSILTSNWGEHEPIVRNATLPGDLNFIYAVLDAIGFNLRQMSTQNIIETCNFFRQRIAEATMPGLLRQEMYDYTEKEIIERLRNGPFDGRLLYRAVEEYFRVNIIVFNNDDEGNIDFPRHRIFHARVFRNRNLVLLYRVASKGEVRYEFITRGVHSNFHPNQCKEIYDMYTRFAGNYRWCDTEESYNLQNKAHLPLIFNTNPIGQFIDEHGRAYGFRFRVNDKTLDLLCVPTQPANCVVLEDIKVTLTREEVEGIFGRPNSIYNDGNGTTGLWYSIFGVRHGVYIPTLPSSYNSDITRELESLSFSSLSTSADSAEVTNFPHYALKLHKKKSVEKNYVTKRHAFIIDFLFKWLYHNSDEDIAGKPEKFWSNYVVVNDGEEDYDFYQLKARLPNVRTVREKMQYLERTKMTVEVVYGSESTYKIRMSKKLAATMYLRLMKYTTILDHRLPFYTKIPRFYEHALDFTNDKGILAFVRIEDLVNWNKSLIDNRIRHNVNVVHNSITVTMQSWEKSFVYRSPKGVLYLVQNCHNPTLLNALKIAQQWNVYRQNYGYNVENETKDMYYRHVLWYLDKNFRMGESVDRTEGGDSYLQVLSYHTLEDTNNPAKRVNDAYAALLPLHYEEGTL